MSKANMMVHVVILAGIFVLTVGSTVLATEGPDGVVEEDVDATEIIEAPASDEGDPVDSAQERTLDLMLMIWILKNPASDGAR